MSDVSDLLVGISVAVPAIASSFVLVWNTVRSGRRPAQEQERVAQQAAEASAAAVLDALVDGELPEEDLAGIRRALHKRQGGGQT